MRSFVWKKKMVGKLILFFARWIMGLYKILLLCSNVIQSIPTVATKDEIFCAPFPNRSLVRAYITIFCYHWNPAENVGGISQPYLGTNLSPCNIHKGNQTTLCFQNHSFHSLRHIQHLQYTIVVVVMDENNTIVVVEKYGWIFLGKIVCKDTWTVNTVILISLHLCLKKSVSGFNWLVNWFIHLRAWMQGWTDRENRSGLRKCCNKLETWSISHRWE